MLDLIKRSGSSKTLMKTVTSALASLSIISSSLTSTTVLGLTTTAAVMLPTGAAHAIGIDEMLARTKRLQNGISAFRSARSQPGSELRDFINHIELPLRFFADGLEDFTPTARDYFNMDRVIAATLSKAQQEYNTALIHDINRLNRLVNSDSPSSVPPNRGVFARLDYRTFDTILNTIGGISALVAASATLINYRRSNPSRLVTSTQVGAGTTTALVAANNFFSRAIMNIGDFQSTSAAQNSGAWNDAFNEGRRVGFAYGHLHVAIRQLRRIKRIPHFNNSPVTRFHIDDALRRHNILNTNIDVRQRAAFANAISKEASNDRCSQPDVNSAFENERCRR